MLSADGWLDTGDLGYIAGGSLFITGRAKDLLIINGRNIWPQDIEHLAEMQPEVRPTDASAFSVPGNDGTEVAVLVVQCRESDIAGLASLVDRLHEAIASGIRHPLPDRAGAAAHPAAHFLRQAVAQHRAQGISRVVTARSA